MRRETEYRIMRTIAGMVAVWSTMMLYVWPNVWSVISLVLASYGLWHYWLRPRR